jgi:large subunit ribosomal protein L30
VTRIEIRQHRSAIGEKKGAKQNLTALGLGRTGQIVTHEDSPTLRGMLRRVAHLVSVSDSQDAPNGASEEGSQGIPPLRNKESR